ncbi:MAG: ABC transporter ATP-binding protein [Spirochaetales bacterium]|nr:ABC transporter ATP-binding protein [Spirochaetales bacterium]
MREHDSGRDKRKSPLLVLKTLYSVLGAYKTTFILALAALGIAVGLSTAGNFIIRAAVDLLIAKQVGAITIIGFALLFLITALLRGLSAFFSGKGCAKSAEKVAYKFRNDLFMHFQALPFSYHDKMQTGELVQRATSDVDSVRKFYYEQIPGVIRIIFLFTINFAAILFLHWQLALGSIIAVPFIILLSLFFFRKIVNGFEAYQNQEGKLSASVQETLSGIRVVKAFARQQWEAGHFDKINAEQCRRGKRLVFLHAAFWPLSVLLCGTQFIAIATIGAYLTLTGDISFGTYVAFTAMVASIIWPLQELGRMIIELSKSSVSFFRIKEILNVAGEDIELGLELKHKLKGNITFKDVCFSYNEGVPILEDINLQIRAGEKIAILGLTGSGKTSLVNLLPRFYDLDKGRIYIDNYALTSLTKKYLRDNIGMVEQEPFLFTTTIRENLLFGVKREITQKEMEQAAKMACIHRTILSFPEGYDTLIGEKGVSLSGGQRQRVAIARTILKDPKILILDDSTSAIDAKTEKKIQQALDHLMRDRTSFIIAHRIETLMKADKIIVMDKGKIVETGRHEELIERPGIYKKIFQIQTDNGKENKYEKARI